MAISFLYDRLALFFTICPAEYKIWLSTALVTYVFACTMLRNSQKRSMEKRHNGDQSPLSAMTLKDAHVIQTWLAEQQFPTTFSAALFCALFKTYSIPSISELLVSTRQFGKPGDIEATSKRAADTSVLLSNMIMRLPGSQQSKEAVARTNYLHNVYRRAGRISNDDMLYTLSLFILEALRWTDKYEWRQLTDMERCAMATCFKVWGEDLEITYEALPSHSTGWKDGLHWLLELDAWSQQYEDQHATTSDANVELMNATRELVLCQIPKFIHNPVWSIFSILLGPRVRQAMRIPDPPKVYESMFNLAVSLRKFVLRYFLPPRPYFLRRVYNAENPNTLTGRYHAQRWVGRPWYVRTSLMHHCSPKAWILWANGSAGQSELSGDRYMPTGYIISDIGPTHFVGKGQLEMKETILSLSSKPSGRCPFSHSKIRY